MSDVRLPKAVRQQVEAANRLQEQFVSQQADPSLVPVEALANPVPAPAAESPVEPQAPQPVTPPAPQENFEHKFKTLQGMFKAELSNQVASQMQQSRQREEELLRSVQQLQDQMRSLKDEKAAPAAMDPKDIEAFGVELVEMVRRQASTEISGAVSKAFGDLQVRLEALERQTKGVSQTMAMTAEQAFYAELGRLVPDWSDVNGNPGFLEWLSQADPVYGEARQVALDRASSSLNADRAAAVFKAYKALAQAPAEIKREPLEGQVAPSRSGSSQAPADTTKQFVSERDIVRFYDDMRRGVYRGRDAEAGAIEAGINLAIAEGRVR